MSNPNEPYNNEGLAFLNIILFTLVLPYYYSIDNGFEKFAQMRITGDCWENAKHERVCTVHRRC